MSEFSDILRNWRRARRFSQLDLAMEADVSSRHISFLETGRARPSPQMISRLCEALKLPMTARNQMLTHAGFAARYPSRKWEEEAMEPVRSAIEHMLQNHAPYPALAIDRMWTILKLNGPARKLFEHFGVGAGDSLLDLLQDPATPARIENWAEVAQNVSNRLHTESAAMGGCEAFDTVAAYLSGFAEPRSGAPGPVIPTIIVMGDIRLSLFATVAQFGTPEDLLLDDLKIEFYFPADSQSRQLLAALAA